MNQAQRYIEDNVVKINIYIRDPYVREIKRDVKISTTTFLSNIGGLLGLCQGFSIISLIEILYFIILWICKKVEKTKDKTNMIEVTSQ